MLLTPILGLPPITVVLSANEGNVNLRTKAGNPAYPCFVTVFVNAGVTISSTSTASPAMDTGTGWAAGTIIRLINNGRIQGMGGDGGRGAMEGPRFGVIGNCASLPGNTGGDALRAQHTLHVINNSEIWAGGGGGGGGGVGDQGSGAGGGGGGGAGTNGGAGGISTTCAFSGAAGSSGNPGTATSGGTGGAGGVFATFNGQGGTGGTGGGPGLPGAAGADGTSTDNSWETGAAGGAAGNYINGNANVTWLVNGDRRGNAV